MVPELAQHPFRLGGEYENRKGLFKVLSISGNKMEIEWDTGERMVTPVELQAKILWNMEREVTAPATKGQLAPKSYGQLFRGLQEGDFSPDVTGTHWRSREQLGGAVTSLLKVSEPFNSWSIYHRPQVHWGSVTRYRLLPPWLQTKFFVHLDEQELLMGLYMERTDNPADNRDDWMSFLSWLENPEHCAWLHNFLQSSGSTIRNPYEEYDNQALRGPITAEDGGTVRLGGTNPQIFPAPRLSQFLAALPGTEYVNLVIGRVIAKNEAILRGVQISNDIADYFNLLLPGYATK